MQRSCQSTRKKNFQHEERAKASNNISQKIVPVTFAAGRQVTVADTSELSPDSFFFLFLHTFDERTTELHLQAEKLTETVLHLNLGHLVGLLCVCVCVCVYSFVLLYASPLMRQQQNNI
jgi:hypothetical protein